MYGGNTGLLLQVCASVDNGDNSKFSLRVWACTQVAIVAEEPCNTDVCVLLLQHTDLIVAMDNEALYHGWYLLTDGTSAFLWSAGRA